MLLENEEEERMEFSTFDDVVQFAIKREEEAAKGYADLRKMAQEEAAKKLLQDLEEEEKNHKKILEGLTKVKLEASASKDVQDLKISDYLIEEPLSPEMNFQELLIFAAKKEKKAAELYQDLAKKSEKKEQKKLFEFLVKQEKTHKLRLELEYEKHVLWED
jgi:rubrerythrin